MTEEERFSKRELVRLMLRTHQQQRLEEFLALQRELAPNARDLGIDSETEVEQLVFENR
jgi:hypothetical protein